MSSKFYKKDTVCVHAGSIPDPQYGGVNSPVFNSSAFEFLDRGQSQYPRYFNTPNQKAIAEKICSLEEGDAALVMSSGMAAISTALASLLTAGDHVVLQDPIYGGTFHFANTQLEKLGVSFTLVRGAEIEDFRAAIQENTKIIYFETPANPLLNIMDVSAMAQLATDHHMISIIDNTFASPINLNPISLGVDVVIHSGTKYLGGHSDLCFGAIVSSNDNIEAFRKTAVNWGGSLDAFTCYQIERSLKTLSLRVNRQNENALQLAQDLAGHVAVEQVYYPGLKSHAGHEIAKAQMKGFGGMLSFCLKENRKNAVDYCNSLNLIKTAVSLGGVETTVTIPSLTSHAKMSAEDRARAGIAEGLIRLSVGIEDVDDLRNDLFQALD